MAKHAKPKSDRAARVTRAAVTLAAGSVAGLTVVPAATAQPAGAAAGQAPGVRDVAAVRQSALAARITQAPVTYTVRPGDSLSEIAQRLCRQAIDWTGLYAHNKGVIGADPNVILPGQVLGVACYDPPVKAAVVHSVSRASGKTWGITYGDPNYCGDGDGDGWDVSCQASDPPQQSGARVQVTADVGSASSSGPWPGGSFGQCVVARESGGNSQVMNSTGHYGLYQFALGTWIAYGGSAADFGHASVAEQERIFMNAIAAGGQSNWSAYDGCLSWSSGIALLSGRCSLQVCLLPSLPSRP